MSYIVSPRNCTIRGSRKFLKNAESYVTIFYGAKMQKLIWVEVKFKT